MNKRRGPPVKKHSYYLTETLGAAFTDFSGDNPSRDIRGAIIGWMALPPGARERLAAAGDTTDVKSGVTQARRVLKEEMANQILLDHARSASATEQLKIVKKAAERA